MSRHRLIAAALSGSPHLFKKTIKKSQVGAKIKKLKAEGKPHDQAVAVALSMSGQSNKGKKS